MSGLRGVDLSQWQTTTPDLSGLDFVLLRAVDGELPDTMYRTHLAAAREVPGLVVGAYAFGYGSAIASPAGQAAAFLRVVGSDTEWLALDRERSSATMTDAEAAAFIAAIHAARRRCGLYASLSGYPAVGQDWRWVAYWAATPPAIPYDLWQYGQDATLHVDGDHYPGTLAQLQALAGLTPEATMIYQRPGLWVATVPKGTTYHHEPTPNSAAGVTAAEADYEITAYTADGSWAALNGVYQGAGTALTACGWVPVNVLGPLRPACPAAPKVSGLAVTYADGTSQPVP